MHPPATTQHYRPELDGLRALAVVAVIIFHLNERWLPAGFLGVDIFFVISGFLITSILVRQMDQLTFTFRSFWSRRVRRIVPLLLTVIVVTVPVAYWLANRNYLDRLCLDALASIGSVQNMRLWLQAGNYWGEDATSSFFLHCWSLSVEEQFYLFYPLFLYRLHRWGGNALKMGVFAVTAISFVAFVYGSQCHPSATFYWLPTRAWELGVGGLIALRLLSPESLGASVFTDDSRPNLWMISSLTIMLIAFCLSQSLGRTVGVPLSVAGAALWIAVANQRGVGRLLAHRWLVHVGKLSYAMYLWHWPVIQIVRQGGILEPDTPAYVICTLGLTYGLSWSSHFWVENRFRFSTWSWPKFWVTVSLVSALLFWFSTSARFDHYVDGPFRKVTMRLRSYDVSPVGSMHGNQPQPRKFAGIAAATRSADHDFAFEREGIVSHHGSDAIEWMVIGDSHAGMWSGLIDDLAAENAATVSFFSASGITPFFEIPLSQRVAERDFSAIQRFRFDEARWQVIRRYHPLVIVSARWYGTSLQHATPMIQAIQQVGGRVLILGPIPEIDVGDQNVLQLLNYKRQHRLHVAVNRIGDAILPIHDPTRLDDAEKALIELSDQNPLCDVVVLSDLYRQPENHTLISSGDNVLYLDDDHLTESGTQLARRRVSDAIKKILQQPAVEAGSAVFDADR